MEKFYTREFMLAFLYDEIPFHLKRQFALVLHEDLSLRRVYYDVKAAVGILKNQKVVKPSERLTRYIKSYADQSLTLVDREHLN